MYESLQLWPASRVQRQATKSRTEPASALAHAGAFSNLSRLARSRTSRTTRYASADFRKATS